MEYQWMSIQDTYKFDLSKNLFLRALAKALEGICTQGAWSFVIA